MDAAARIRLFLCGDVMTGRGIDQILPHPVDPVLYEPSVRDARRYVELAERANGPVPRPVGFAYPWGDALSELERAAPDLRIVNLETAVTTADSPWPGKRIHYRMHPLNVPCLEAAGIDCCVLANNHVLDWGYRGLSDTLRTLEEAGIRTAGAGRNLEEAARPATFELEHGGRVLVFAAGSTSSGIPAEWAATDDRAGVHLIDETSPGVGRRLRDQIRRYAAEDDVVVLSVHWGPNWGYGVSEARRRLARTAIDTLGVDLVHGHSSHHVLGLEVHGGRPILYGCGDFLTDYEGIEGHVEYRGDLGYVYLADLSPRSGDLRRLEMRPTRMHRMQVRRATPEQAEWLARVQERHGLPATARVELAEDGTLLLRSRSD